MLDSTLIYPLAMFTMVALVGFAFWQLYRVDDAKKTNAHSALAKDEIQPARPGDGQPTTKNV